MTSPLVLATSLTIVGRPRRLCSPAAASLPLRVAPAWGQRGLATPDALPELGGNREAVRPLDLGLYAKGERLFHRAVRG